MHILVTMPKGSVFETFFPLMARDEIEGLGSVAWNDLGRDFTKAELSERLRGVDVCITGWGTVGFDAEVLAGADSLKLLVHTAGSVARLVSAELYDRGVRVLSGNQLFAESVAEGIICYALAGLRQLPLYINELKNGRWRGSEFTNQGLLDQTVGLVGFGMVARELVRLLVPFRAKILVHAPHLAAGEASRLGVELVGLEEAFSRPGIISLQLARRPESFHLIGRDLLGRIRDNALLINTARGSIIDEAALADELIRGRFSSVLDVYEEEPLPATSPLLRLPNVICMPHMAGPTVDRRARITHELAGDIGRFAAGAPLRYEISREYSGYMTE